MEFWLHNDLIFCIFRNFYVIFKGFELSNQIKLRLDFQNPILYDIAWGIRKLYQIDLKTSFLCHNNVIFTSFYRYSNIFCYKILKNYATCLKFGMSLEKHVNYQPRLKKALSSKIFPASALASKFCSEIFIKKFNNS